MTRTPRSPLTVVGQRCITLSGQTVTYTVKRSHRARYVRFEVRRETGLTVVIPRSYDIGRLNGLLETKRNWIVSRLAKCTESSPATRDIRSGDTIPYLGGRLALVRRQNHAGRDTVRLENGTLVATLKSADSSLSTAVEGWLRAQAATVIGKKAEETSARMGLKYDRLTIRGQKTRWGSCSRRGNLSFNWRLMMAPEAIVDYVVTHEVAHLKEMNHTKQFWKLVAEYCPGWQQHRRWLTAHGTELAARTKM
ncbi:MAG: SprT family zinc-dependent metalloprotease [Chloroflexi bacterium]|nr:SprT family zinc-dependent metalloprotease [Chloroflexota bacterium]